MQRTCAYGSYHMAVGQLSESAVVAGQISNNVSLNRKYHDNPEACDLSEFMVVSNTLSGPRDVVDLFYDNKIGIDVDVCIHETIHETLTILHLYF